MKAIFVSKNAIGGPKYFEYTINGKRIYIQSSSYIVKIGDWGMSVKFGVL